MLPDFVIIGAMKCGTSTMAAQLGAQPGIFMTDPKEPNFFSDDAEYEKGLDYYERLFSNAAANDIKGEASTHYTKMPTYPDTLARMSATLGNPKMIYMIRNPLARVVSHYIHEWTMGIIQEDLNTALANHPELVEYGRYGKQIAPFVEQFGGENIYIASLEDMQASPQSALEAICKFLDYPGSPAWQEEQSKMNVSSERIRRFPLHGLLIDNPVSRALRRTLVPQSVRDRIKNSRQIQARPTLSPSTEKALEQVFAEDFVNLQDLFPENPSIKQCYPFLNDG